MTINTVFSILLTLLMDMNAWFVLAKVSFPDEQAGRIGVSNVSNTTVSPGPLFSLPNLFYRVLEAADSESYHLVDT